MNVTGEQSQISQRDLPISRGPAGDSLGAGGGWESIFENDQSDKVLNKDGAACRLCFSPRMFGHDFPSFFFPDVRICWTSLEVKQMGPGAALCRIYLRIPTPAPVLEHALQIKEGLKIPKGTPQQKWPGLNSR